MEIYWSILTSRGYPTKEDKLREEEEYLRQLEKIHLMLVAEKGSDKREEEFEVLVDSIKSTDFMSLKRSAEGELKQSLETATESERTGMYSALMSKKAFFDYIVRTGGEGIMVKDIHSIYEQKRTRAYQKIKKNTV